MTIEKICENFKITGKLLRCKPINNGIINTSYKVCYEENGEQKEYVIQKINKAVFRRPDKVMQNIKNVTEFIKNKIKTLGKDAERYALTCGETVEGKNYLIDDNGDYWRAYLFIGHSKVYNEATDLGVIEEIGRAFGEFQVYLTDYDASSLYTAIPNFHNTHARFSTFDEVVLVDAADRVSSVTEEIAKLKSFEELASKLSIMAKQGEIPLRVTHNDTKSNNVLFDEEGKTALTVIDLDTIMPGLVAYDFGDAVRFICSNANEDEFDLSKVTLNLDKFRALTKGFLGAVGKMLTQVEVKSLVLGVYSMTVELAVRFLTDYLDGDAYFKVAYPGHNLDRARCQIKLAEDIYSKFDELEEIVKEFI